MYRASLYYGLRQGNNLEDSASLTASPPRPCGTRPLASFGTRSRRRVERPTRVIGSEVEMVGFDHRIAAPNAWWAAAEINRPPASGAKPLRGEEVNAPGRSRTDDRSSKRPHGYRTSDASHRSPCIGALAPWDPQPLEGTSQLLALKRVRLATVRCETPSAVRHAPQLAASGATIQLCFQGHSLLHTVSGERSRPPN